MLRSRQSIRNNHKGNTRELNNREKRESNIVFKRNVRVNKDPYKSFAPEKTYIVKRTNLKGLTLIIIASFFLFITSVGLFRFGFSFNLFILFTICLIALISGIYLFVKSQLIDSKSVKEYSIILSNDGLSLEGVFFKWSQIKNEKIINQHTGNSSNFFLFFEIPSANRISKFPLMSFGVSISELKYLLTVYRSRYKNKLIFQSDKFERKYINMQKKDKYILR